VEEVAVDAVSVDFTALCFEESSSGMVICLSEVVVEVVVVLCERAIESESVGRTVSAFLSLKRFWFGGGTMSLEIWWFLV
jgi:hypothetical protein